MRMFQPITKKFAKKCKLFEEADLDFMKNIGVLILSEEMEDVFCEAGHSRWWLVAHPHLDLYENGTQIEYPPMMLSLLTNDKNGITDRPNGNTYFDDSYFDLLSDLGIEEKKILFRRLLSFPSMHPHVSNSCGICTGSGQGVYYLQQDLKHNQESLMMMILDLKRWASSVHIHGAYYEPGSYLIPELPPKIVRKWNATESTKNVFFSKFSNQQDACALAGYLKISGSVLLKSLVKKKVEESITWDVDPNVPITKIKNIEQGVTSEMIMTIAFVDVIHKVIEKNKSKKILKKDLSGFSDEMLEKMGEIVGKEDAGKMFAPLYSYSKYLDGLCDVEEWLSKTVLTHEISSGWINQQDADNFIIGSSANAISLIVALLEKDGNSLSINMTNEDTILKSVFGDSIDNTADLMIKTYAKIAYVQERRLAYQHHQKERRLNDFLRHLEANGGENPLLP